MNDEQEREFFDHHERTHEDPREHAATCGICEAEVEERTANGEYDEATA